MYARRTLLALVTASSAFALFALGPVAGEREARTASDVTQPGRNLDRALDAVLAPDPERPAPRSLIFLVDPTKTLQEFGFRERLAQALQRRAADLKGVDIGLALVGGKGSLVRAPSADRLQWLLDLDQALAAAKGNPVRNVYADVRAAAGAFAGEKGARDLVLVTLDNGDAEDDLEATVKALERARVRLTVIAREAYLADSYAWSHRGSVEAPKGTSLLGGDGAWPEIPWGWLLQQETGHEVAPSGLAAYGLTRLAAESGGRVFLAAASTGAHACAIYGTCSFCSGAEHLPPWEAYQAHRVKALAPSIASRADVLDRDAKDPWLRRTLALWTDAGKAGLIRSRPTAAHGAGGLALEPPKSGAPSFAVPLGSLAFPRVAKDAAKARQEAERLLLAFDADVAKLAPDDGAARHRATAELSGVLLHLTAVNLALLEAFCQEAGPAMLEPPDAVPAAPETGLVGAGYRVVGWSYHTHCLCHGVEPFRQVRMALAPDAQKALLDALAARLGPYFARYDHTPFGVAARRSGLALFVPTVQGKTTPPPPRKGGSRESDEDAPTTPSDRPGRSGGGSGEGGPATTGK
jgi:hypothetical protein